MSKHAYMKAKVYEGMFHNEKFVHVPCGLKTAVQPGGPGRAGQLRHQRPSNQKQTLCNGYWYCRCRRA